MFAHGESEIETQKTEYAPQEEDEEHSAKNHELDEFRVGFDAGENPMRAGMSWHKSPSRLKETCLSWCSRFMPQPEG
jgi:hypothetical protein